MLTRRSQGHKPQVVFTADFHQLVRGDLLPGPVVLRYDPYRIVPPEEVATLPATQQPIIVECGFHPNGGSWRGEMRFPPAKRLQADWDPTGQGTMLEIAVPPPQNCDELEFWFTYTDNHGKIHFDSANGDNYWARFPSHDLETINGDLVDVAGQPLNSFNLTVASVPAVESLTVRWRYTALPDHPRQQQALTASTGDDGTKTWTAAGRSLSVASATPIAFDLVYTVGGHVFTDDNEGNWYVIAPPEPRTGP